MRKNASLTKRLGIHNIIFGAIVLLALIAAVISIKYEQNIFPKARIANTVIDNDTTVDPQTKEFYDLSVDTKVNTLKPTKTNPSYVFETTLTLGGARLTNTSTLYGFKQRSEGQNMADAFPFSRDPSAKSDQFVAKNIPLLYSNCIDLHSSNARERNSYLATLCYKNTVLPNGGISTSAYSPAGNTIIFLEYNGKQAASIQSFSTAFDKYVAKPAQNVDGPLMTRVNYFSLDTQHASVSDFSNVWYQLQGLTSGLSTEQIGSLCYTALTNPQKYVKFTISPKPSGGENVPMTENFGACTYVLKNSPLKLLYLSLWMDGGIPVPQPTPVPSPTPPASCKPRPACLDFRPACKLPTPVEGWCPSPLPSASPSVTPLPSVLPSPLPTITPVPTILPKKGSPKIPLPVNQ